MLVGTDTVSIYALMTAIYMGFDEIYLLGIEHNYFLKPEENHRFFQNAIHQKDQIKRISSTLNHKSYNTFLLEGTAKIFNLYLLLDKNSNCKIYNTSKDSLLDIFDFKNFKKIFEN